MPPTPLHRQSFLRFPAGFCAPWYSFGTERWDDRVSRAYLGYLRLFYRFGKRRKRCKYRGIRVFPACLVSTIFVAQNAVCNGFGCGLGGRAGEHHEHQLGVCGPMGGLRWAVFRAPQYERACIADIKHQSCRYCCRYLVLGPF